MERTEGSVWLRAAAVVIFLAVCAYAAAWLVLGLGGGRRTVVVHRREIVESARISGIALRSEEPVSGSLPAADGERVSPASSGLSDSALIFSQTDGYEYLSPEELEELSVEKVKKLLAAEPEHSRASYRAVYGFAWYFAAVADESIPLREGERCSLIFDGLDKCAEAVAETVGESENGQRAVLLRLTADTPEYLSLRRCGAEIIFSRIEGLELPTEAVRTDAEGNNFVYSTTAGLTERRRVDIIYTSTAGDFCLAAESAELDALREGSVVIVSGKETEGSV